MNDILAYPDMENYLRVFYSEYLLDMYPKEAYHLPLARMEHLVFVRKSLKMLYKIMKKH